MKQPWNHYGELHGRGFLTGQAAKKLEEAASIKYDEEFVNEALGAIVYIGMAIIHERNRITDIDRIGSIETETFGNLDTGQSGKETIVSAVASGQIDPTVINPPIGRRIDARTVTDADLRRGPEKRSPSYRATRNT